MKNKDYHCSITAAITAAEACKNISNVAGWWTENINGSPQKPNDIFTVYFDETFVTFKVASIIPNKRIIWEVIDCNLAWLNNKKEWNNTSVAWEISSGNNSTQIDMTHTGLVEGIECYTDCRTGWNYYITESLFKLVTGHKGLPEKKKNF